MQQDNNQKKANALGWLFFAMIVTYLAVEVAVALLNEKGIELSVPLTLVVSEGILVVPTLIYILMSNCNWKEDLAFRGMKIGTIFLSIFLGFIVMPIAAFVNVVTQFFVENTMTAMSDTLITGQSFPFILFMSGVLAPFCEELAFRSVFFERFGKIATPMRAVFCSALFFGLMHLNVNQTCYAFVLGLLFAVANRASGSVFTSIIMHMVINCFNMIMMYVSMMVLQNSEINLAEAAEQTRTSGTLYIMAGVYLVLAIICLAIYVPLVVAMSKHEGRYEEFVSMFSRKKSDSEKLPKILLNVPALITVGLCIFIIFGLTPIMEMMGWM